MNPLFSKPAAIPARWLGALLTLLVFLSLGHAEPAGGGRWLLVFDTSSTMKKRLPATEAALKRFLTTSADGQIQAGDSVGVWFFEQQLNGQFPTWNWDPKLTGTTSSNLCTYLRGLRHRKDSNLGILQAPLNRVVTDSKRLTIVIFSDGQSDVVGTPYDEGINQTFREAQAERKKSQQPFVVVMRTQFGQYIGCTLNFPPGAINLPPFPAPPPPPAPVAPPPAPVKVISPPVAVPALVIVGTQVGTNLNTPIPAPTNNVRVSPPTNEILKAPNPTSQTSATTPRIVVITNYVTVQTVPIITNPATTVSNPVVPVIAATPTNVPPPAEKTVAAATTPATNLVTATVPKEPDADTNPMIYVGIALLVAAGLLVVILLVRPGHRPHSSLITSSMQDDPRRK